jgi:hypothetical protein
MGQFSVEISARPGQLSAEINNLSFQHGGAVVDHVALKGPMLMVNFSF